MTQQPEEQQPRRRGRKRRWFLIALGALLVFIIIGALGDDPDDDDDTAAPPSPSPTAEATTPEPEPTTPEPEPTPDEPEFNADAAREELLEDVHAANGFRPLEESCTTERLIEGTWFQCYFDDVEFTSPSQLRVTLTTPGDVNDQGIHESTRTWFVNMINPEDSDHYPDLRSVYTTVNGRDSARTGTW